MRTNERATGALRIGPCHAPPRRPAQRRARPHPKETILVGCPADEWHTFTPLLLSLLLRRRGYKVIYLGANVPASRFTETVKDTKADLVLLVAQQLVSAATLQGTAHALASKNIPVAFGGRIFNLRPSLMEYIPGYFLGNEIGAAIGEIEKILKAKSLPKAAKIASQAHIAAHQAFTSKRTKIEATLKEMLQPLAISPNDINTGIHFLGDHITAALQLGDMAHVSAEIDWLKMLLQSHATHPEQFVQFFEAYAKAVDKNINGQGKPIYEWFKEQSQKLLALKVKTLHEQTRRTQPTRPGLHPDGFQGKRGQPLGFSRQKERPAGLQPRFFLTILPPAHGAVAPGL